MNLDSILFHIQNCSILAAETAVILLTFARFRRTRERGFALIGISSVVFCLLVGFYYIVSDDSLGAQPASRIAGTAIYVLGAILWVFGVASVCRGPSARPKQGSR